MYTIKEAATRSGMSVSLIRAWERRYGVVHPARTESGYRLYDDRAIATLRAMRGLIEGGWHASQAARAISAGEIPIDIWAARSGPTRAATPALDADRGRDPIGAFVAAAASYDVAGIEAALDEIFSRGSYEAIVDDLIMPAAVALGRGWAAGNIDVAAEHLASAAIGRRLARALEAAGRPVTDPPVVIGLPPNSRHELGALGFAVGLRRRGVAVLYLGPDVPVPSWVDAVASTAARAAVVGVVTADDVPGARSVQTRLRIRDPLLLIALGGGAAGRLAVRPDDARTTVLPQLLVDAVDAVIGALEAAGR